MRTGDHIMAYPYRQWISNPRLGVGKEIVARTSYELDTKVAKQQDTWNEQERVLNMKEEAVHLSQRAQEELRVHRNLLAQGINNTARFTLDSLYERSSFLEKEPQFETYLKTHDVPQPRRWLEEFVPYIKAQREKRLLEAKAEFERDISKYQSRKDAFYRAQQVQNRGIDEFRRRLTNGDPEAIEQYLLRVLRESEYPNSFKKEMDLLFDPTEQLVAINYWLPCPDELPTIHEYRFVPSKTEIVQMTLKPRETEVLFDTIVYQSALRTLYEAFKALAGNKSVQCVCYNGYVKGVDRATGQDFQSCIVSVQMSLEEFQSIKFDRIDPKECFRRLKGISSGALHTLMPVKPIFKLNKIDARFRETRDVLAELNSVPNLCNIPWDDFEHLVTQLFQKKLAGNDHIEIRTTRSGNDAGVDAIIYDESLVSGGKTYIQAKRYKGYVDPSIVKALWGTMDDERASKGILVTTGYFGNETRRFAQDKPIQLINGQELVGMLDEIGFKAKVNPIKRR